MKEMMQNKPTGHYISPAYDFNATRHFLADDKDLEIPAQWRKPANLSDDQMKDSMTSDEIIKATAIKIKKELLPLVKEGKVEFKKVNEIIDLYRNNEPCLDLIDNQDLC
ncbi:MAG: hypothetical protein JSW20_09955 [Nitrospiraceae bacterium]|nr:MAG: hypothetical protein JSW20_09955 [Nitrospiraceae bacterium]